jgi:hypothetical protein
MGMTLWLITVIPADVVVYIIGIRRHLYPLPSFSRRRESSPSIN